MKFEAAFDRLIGVEGGYSFDAADPGGETMFGVTARVARAHGYVGDMRLLPRETAAAIYRARYWSDVRADELPDLLRFEVFDAAVNSGVPQAVKWLQRAVGAVDDGVLGPATIAAALGAVPWRAAVSLNAERLALMASLGTWTRFGRGWARRIAGNLRALAATSRGEPWSGAVASIADQLIQMADLPTWGANGRDWAQRISSNLAALVAQQE